MEARKEVIDKWTKQNDHCLTVACLRRTWFLERVLKLGLVNIAKEYLCVRVIYLALLVLQHLMFLIPVCYMSRSTSMRQGLGGQMAPELYCALPLR